MSTWTVLVLLAAMLGFPRAAFGAPIAELLAPGVMRFHADVAAKANAEPSVALVHPFAGTPIGLGGLDPVPAFDTAVGKWRVTIPVAPGTTLYGTGLVVGPFERTGQLVEVYTHDAFAWGEQSRKLYQAHPWIMGVRADGTSFGILFDSTWRAQIDTTDPLAHGIVYTTEGPAPAVIVINHPGPLQVVQTLATLTGAPALQPRWATGYHQCRYQDAPQQEVVDIARGLRLREIPCDVMYIDIEYMDGFRAFTFDPVTFPDPAGLNDALHDMGFKAVWNVSPTIKREGGFPPYDQGAALGYFVKLADGTTDFVGEGWSGDSTYVDYTNPAARQWFAAQYTTLTNIGADAIWVDVNEPSVFNAAPTYAMPDDAVHHADPALGGTGPHVKYRNIYGMQSARCAFEGLAGALPDRRPFVLTRSNYLGGQRYAATWSGDNVSDEYHYAMTIPQILGLGLSGQPYSGNDIAGFALQETPELYAKWIGLGALAPFSRGHSLRDACEPWMFGGDVEYTARLAIDRRYWLLPYLDGLFFEAHTQGSPIARPVFFADPANANLRTEQDSFLLGDAILVVASPTLDTEPSPPDIGENLRRFGLPISRDPESDLDTFRADLPHLYLRPGHIVPTGPLMQSTGERPLDDLTLIVALDDNGQATGTLYEDAGEGWGLYAGDFRQSVYAAWRTGNTVHVLRQGAIGNRPAIPRPLHIRVLGDDGNEYRGSGTDGQEVIVAIAQVQAPPPVDPRAIDGRRITTAFNGAPALATGIAGPGPQIPGVLGSVHGRCGAQSVRLGITGTVPFANSATIVLLDTAPGGPAHLGAPFEGEPGAISALAGATFDAGFTPEAALVLDTTGGGIWTFLVRFNADGSISSSTFLGRGVAGEGSGELRSGVNPAHVRTALDYGAFGGTPPPGRPLRDPATIGFEIDIPWSALGFAAKPTQAVRCALLQAHRDPERIDHMLPDTGVGSFPLAPGPDFASIPGPQFITIPNGCAGDITGDDRTNTGDFNMLAAHFGQTVAPGTSGDITGDGKVNTADFNVIAGDFACGS